ncbi:MAG: hypothetical protein ACETWR_11755 [Anaerolineae bacterium]
MNENSIHPMDEDEARLVEQLRALAGTTQPRPEFAAQLEAGLLAQWKSTPTQDGPRRMIHLTTWWRRPMFKRLSLALISAAVVALALIFVLPLLLGDGSGPLAPLPLLADQPELAGDFQAGRPMGPLGDVELVLEADLPEGPTEAPVYRQASGALPTTPEEALAWAERFNLPNPQVYRDIPDPSALFVTADDGQTLSFNADAPWAISYGRGVDPFFEWRADDPDTPPPLSFEAARDIAITFLQARDLLPDAYQVEEAGGMAPPGVESPPIRHVLIRPLLDGYLVEGHDAEIRVMVGPDGTVYSVWLSPLTFARGETYPLRSAQAAFEALRTGDVKGPFRLSIDWHAPPEAVAEAAQTTYYRPEPATYQAGDAATVRGSVQLLRAVATGEVRARLSNNDGTFELTGLALEEMAAELGYNQVVVQGTIQAELGPRRWRLAVSDWSIAPPQVNRFVGTVEMEGGTTSLVADDGACYRLLSPPDGLSAGDRVAVYAEVPAEGEELPGLRWLGIQSPPATQQYVSGSSESVSVVVQVEEAIEAAPGPVAQVIVGAIHFEEDGPVLETPEGQRFRVAGLPDELNDGRDGRVIAVRGQVTPPAEAGDLPTLVWVAEEPVPEPAELHQEIVSEQVEVAPPAGYEPPVSPYQIGDEVELEGMVGAAIFVNGDERWVEAWFRVGLGPDSDLNYRLSGPPDLLEELAQYDRLHLRLQARVIPDEDSPLGQGLEVIRFEKIWPEEKVQGFLGTIGVETLDRREVAIFTDKETGQRYVLFLSLSEHFNSEEYRRYFEEDYKRYEQLFLTGVVRPDQTFAGLPVIEEEGIRAGGEVDAATSADQLPLEVPQVIDESMTHLKGRAIINRLELAYYAPPGALGQRPGAEAQPEFSLVQPVWVFHGHSEDGRATFCAYVQAVADDYLQ